MIMLIRLRRVYRGSRTSPSYGGTVFTPETAHAIANSDGGYGGCPEGLLAASLEFFRNGHPPVDSGETLEIYGRQTCFPSPCVVAFTAWPTSKLLTCLCSLGRSAYMAAASASKAHGGVKVELESMILGAMGAAQSIIAAEWCKSGEGEAPSAQKFWDVVRPR